MKFKGTFKSSRKVLILGIICLIFLAGFLGWLYFGDGTKKLSGRDYKNYRNENYGFSFQYPRGYYLSELSTKDNKETHIGIGEQTASGKRGSFYIYAMKDMPYDLSVRESTNGCGDKNILNTNFTFEGFPAHKVVAVQAITGRENTCIDIKKNNIVYSISGISKDTQEPKRAIFNQLFSTFKFESQ